MLDPTTPSRQIVTSSDLVRHFGYWQDRAARTPVYILHRGRPRLVLTSVEIMDALCAPHSSGSGVGPDLAAVLERIEDRVLIANDHHQIVAVSEPARRHFGALADDGLPLIGIVSEDRRNQFGTALDRVSRTGIPYALDLRARTARDIGTTLLIDTWPGGLMVVARDAGGADLRDRAAFDEAIAASAAIAPARIDLRGRVETGQAALAAWCDVRVDALASMPFAQLFAAESQAAIRAAIDRVIQAAEPQQIDAVLQSRRITSAPVRVGLAPRRDGASVSGIAAVLVAPAG